MHVVESAAVQNDWFWYLHGSVLINTLVHACKTPWLPVWLFGQSACRACRQPFARQPFTACRQPFTAVQVIKVGTSSLIREDLNSLHLVNLGKICETVRRLKDAGTLTTCSSAHTALAACFGPIATERQALCCLRWSRL
jgi:hypothetical protein